MKTHTIEVTPEIAQALTAASDVLRTEANELASFNDASSAAREGKPSTIPPRVHTAVSTEISRLRGISEKLLSLLPPPPPTDDT